MFDAREDAFSSRVNADARMIRRKPGDIEQLSLNRIAARAVHIALSLSADSDRLQIGANLQECVLELKTRPREEACPRWINARLPQALLVLPVHSTHAGAHNANQQATVIINAHL